MVVAGGPGFAGSHRRREGGSGGDRAAWTREHEGEEAGCGSAGLTLVRISPAMACCGCAAGRRPANGDPVRCCGGRWIGGSGRPAAAPGDGVRIWSQGEGDDSFGQRKGENMGLCWRLRLEKEEMDLGLGFGLD